VKKHLLKGEVESLEYGRYFPICPDIQGCYAEGDAIAEALEDAKEETWNSTRPNSSWPGATTDQSPY